MRYVHLPGAAVDTALLEDATRRGNLILASHERSRTDYLATPQKQRSRPLKPDN